MRVDGRRVRVRGGRFSATVGLHLGGNDIEVVATAPGFEEDVTTRSLTRRRSAAELAELRRKREEARLARIAALTQTFSGNGSTNLGTITVEEESVLEWTNVDAEFPEFQQILIYDKGFGISVASEGSSGKSIVEPGRYRQVTVAGNDWTIKISPRF